MAVVLAMAGWAGQAGAVIGTIDNVPAATLLLPYFEVDLGNPNGVNTLLSINNASAAAVLVHVVVYGDLSVPTANFNMYLTGYDVQTISMRDILNGVLPQTADFIRDPSDTISHRGAFSGEANYACGPPAAGQPALLPPAPVPAGFATHMANAHTGKSSAFLGNRCAGQNLGDNVARGYVVVNQINDCTLLFPGDPGYFGIGGFVGNLNQLWGDYFYVNSAENFAQGNPLVHVEASGTDPVTTIPGNYTFYGRYVAFTAADNREPLATTFAARYLNGGDFNGGASLVVWRDSKVNQGPFTCPAIQGVRPPWFPLAKTQVVIFDEQEQPVITEEPVGPPPPPGPEPFPAEAQRVRVDGPELAVPFSFGWIYLNLNTSTGSVVDPFAQAWVETVMDAQGRFSVGFNAFQLDNASQPNTIIIPVP
jgi:hypothetical protein